MARVLAAVVVSLVLAGGVVAAQDTVRHSGLVLDVGQSEIVLEEVGPWQVREGKTVTKQVRIALTPSTAVVRVTRQEDAAFPGAFVEQPIPAGQIKPGDFATVECSRTVALTGLKVSLMSLDGGSR